MPPSATDHVLLFGMVAVQVEAITQEQLVEGLKVWMAQKHRKLSDVLVELGAMEESQVEGIDTLVAAQMLRDGDAVQSLAAYDAYQSFRERLEEIQDRDIEATLLLSDTTRSALLKDDAVEPTRANGQQRFEAVRFHDEGGLGRVFEARDRELNRNVALKEIKALFADDIESRQRFVMEAEITGRLEHPGIVPVYGLGHYDDGRPYYAMRFIHGDSFREAIRQFHADHEHRDSSFELRKLLNRFLDVCHAIHYAHRRGILHRDIKPSNIMLGDYGETLVVDWGLAKPIGERDQFTARAVEHEAALLPASGSTIAPTIVGQAVGSPPYMSPEQARGDHLELGPATDIYSLGATLYTLLTNETPIKGTSSEDILREVRRGNTRAPREINPKVPGALNAICLKAMAPETTDRYESVNQLSDDVERFLADEPVSAYHEPWHERLFRFGRRNKALVQTAMIGLLLVATVSLANALRLQLQAANVDARRAKVAQARAEFTEYLLASSSKPADLSPAELDTLSSKIDDLAESLSEDPLAEADFSEVISQNLLIQGVFEPSEKWARRCLELRQRELGPNAPETTLSKLILAEVLNRRSKFQEALTLFVDVRQRFRTGRGPRDRLTMSATNNVATVNRNLGRYDEAIAIFKQVAAERQEALGATDEETLNARNNLAMTLRDVGKRKQALDMLQDVLAIRLKSVGKHNLFTVQSMNNVGLLLTEVGEHKASVEMLRETLELREELLSKRHPDTLTTRQNLAAAYAWVDEWEKAREQYEWVSEQRRWVLGPEHADTLFSKFGLAKATYRAKGPEGTAALFKEVVLGWEAVYGVEHVRTRSAAYRYLLAALEEASFESAVMICERFVKLLSDSPREQARFLALLAELRLAMAQPEPAADAADRAIDVAGGDEGLAFTAAVATSALGQSWIDRGHRQKGEALVVTAQQKFGQLEPKPHERFLKELNGQRVPAGE